MAPLLSNISLFLLFYNLAPPTRSTLILQAARVTAGGVPGTSAEVDQDLRPATAAIPDVHVNKGARSQNRAFCLRERTAATYTG